MVSTHVTEDGQHWDYPRLPTQKEWNALWHTLAVGMFYREQSDANPAVFYHWEQQTLATKLHYQAKAKKALQGFKP